MILGGLSSWCRVAPLVASAIVLVLTSVPGRGQPAGGLCPTAVFEGRYCAHDLEGWTVYVSAALISRNEGLARGALDLLSQRLVEVVQVVPALRLPELRRVAFWIGNRTDGAGLHYHSGGSRYPRDAGEPEAQVGGIGIRDPHHFINIRFSQPSVILHELAHAYHDQVLGYDDPTLLNAFRAAQERGLYRDVKRNDGTIGRAYALTNHHEYFAELSEAYFGTNDFYPFRRDDLRAYDPPGFQALRSLWEARPAMTEESISLSSDTEPSRAATAACATDTARRSQHSREPARLVLRNRTPHRVDLLWLNFQGRPQAYAQLAPGALHVQSTYVSHPWLLADPAGKCLAVVMPKKDGSYVALAP